MRGEEVLPQGTCTASWAPPRATRRDPRGTAPAGAGSLTHRATVLATTAGSVPAASSARMISKAPLAWTFRDSEARVRLGRVHHAGTRCPGSTSDTFTRVRRVLLHPQRIRAHHRRGRRGRVHRSIVRPADPTADAAYGDDAPPRCPPSPGRSDGPCARRREPGRHLRLAQRAVVVDAARSTEPASRLTSTESSPCLATMASTQRLTESSSVTSSARTRLRAVFARPAGSRPCVTGVHLALHPDREVPYTTDAGNALRSSSSMSLRGRWTRR